MLRTIPSLALFASLCVTQAPTFAQEVHGAIDATRGIRIVRLWGTPEQRGFAHGKLLGGEIADLIRAEYRSMFGDDDKLLNVGRASLRRLIEYPEPVERELDAIHRGMVASGADLRVFDRKLDATDLKFVNAFDVFATIACSGFTVWGDQVEGGGVLTTRNFDWPVSGPHIVDATIVLVQQPDDGHATATVSWPGYLGCVTGISETGVAAFLHVGSGDRGNPEPGSMPTATAALEVLRGSTVDALPDVARTLLEETSPPCSYISRFVAPRLPEGRETPVCVFEAETRSVTMKDRECPCIVTNTFHGDGLEECDRYSSIDKHVAECLTEDDKKVSVSEAWSGLEAVDVSGRRFATLHSLVFRADPWVFEIAVGVVQQDGIVKSAVRTDRRYTLSREDLFRRDTAR